MHIEFGDEIKEHPCACCGRAVRSGQGFVDDGDVAGRYWFDMASHGSERRTRLLVALDRVHRARSFRPSVSFVVHGRLAPRGLAFSLQNRSHSPVVPRRQLTGRTLGRRRALRHTRLPVLWEIVDVVIERDPALADFFDTTSEHD